MKNIKERIILNLSKVLVIFVVGLVSRVLVNNFWDVNVFVDYFNSISLEYYGFMAIFVLLVNELFNYIDIKLLPKISMDVFSISSIRKAISVIISNIGNKGKIPISGDLGLEKVLDKSNKVKVSGILFAGESSDNNVNRGRGKGIRSKGVIGSSKGVSGSSKGVGGDYIDRDYVDKGLRSKKGVSNMRSYYDNATKSNTIKSTTTKSNAPIVHNSLRSQNVRSLNTGSCVDSAPNISTIISINGNDNTRTGSPNILSINGNDNTITGSSNIVNISATVGDSPGCFSNLKVGSKRRIVWYM
jgi:hypothetical protein